MVHNPSRPSLAPASLSARATVAHVVVLFDENGRPHDTTVLFAVTRLSARRLRARLQNANARWVALDRRARALATEDGALAWDYLLACRRRSADAALASQGLVRQPFGYLAVEDDTVADVTDGLADSAA